MSKKPSLPSDNSDLKDPKHDPPRLLNKKHLLQRVPLSYVTIWKMMKLGKFPRSHRIGGRVFWLEAEISAWILAQCQ
jgi:prophage regulatory protein